MVFREVKDVIKHEVQPKYLEKIEFELKEEESNSTAKEESEDEEPQTPGVRISVQKRRQPERYSPSAFCSNFALSITDDDLRTVKEAVDSVSLCEGYDRRQKGVAGKGGHFEEYYRCIDKICELWDFLLM